MLTTCLIVLAFLLANVSSQHIRILGAPENGVVIPMEITLKERSMLSVSGQPDPPQLFFRPSVNLYDFDKQLEAIRIKSENVCYIKTYTFDKTDIRNLIDDVITTQSKFLTQVTEEWNVKGEKIADEDLLETVGSKITRFCDGLEVYWMEGGHEVKDNDLMTRLSKRGSVGISVSGSISVGSHSYSGSASASVGEGSASSHASSSSGSSKSSSSSSSSSCG